MADKPILFSAPMILALLREIEKPGTGKTMTRRVIKPNAAARRWNCDLNACPAARFSIGADGRGYAAFDHPRGGPYTALVVSKPGDRLWVREKHWVVEIEGGGIGCPYLVYDDEWTSGPGAKMPAPKEERIWWGPPYDEAANPKFGARPSIHMPRWASRITCYVTDVKVERVQEISERDAIAEGVRLSPDRRPHYRLDLPPGNDLGAGAVDADSARSCFRRLWNCLNTKRGCGWDDNPWVGAYTFVPRLGNIDDMPEALAA